MQAFAHAWHASSHTPFDLDSGAPFSHPAWPAGVATPTRDEVRALHHLDLLEVDSSVSRIWRVFPSPEARIRYGGPDQAHVAAALRDPDRRLAVILEATVQAFEADPREPLHFSPMDQISLVKHPHWPLAPDVVRSHDLAQLEDLGLVATEPRAKDTAFWPTPAGRAAAHDPASYLDCRAAEATNEEERSRLRRWAAKTRAGDVAVGTLTGASSVVIRALIGLP